MKNALGGLSALLAMMALLAASGAVTLAAQTTAKPSRSTRAWAPPRTPWGDPDLSGIYTNKYEQRTPMERPPELAGRRLEEITAEELEDIVQTRQRQVIARQPFAGGDPEGRIGYGIQWTDMLSVHGAHRPWMVVDPSDGQIPPATPEAGQRAIRRTAAARTGRGPADSYEDRSLYDRCITRGLPGSMLPSNYGNSFQIVQSPGRVAIVYEMIHETRVIPLDGSAHVGKGLRLEKRPDRQTVPVRIAVHREVYPVGRHRLCEHSIGVGPRAARWRRANAYAISAVCVAPSAGCPCMAGGSCVK